MILSDYQSAEYLELKDAFDKHYHDQIYPFLKNKEDIRLKYVNRFISLCLMAAFILPVLTIIVYYFNRYHQADIDWGLFFIPIAIGIYVISSPYRKYRAEMKQNVMDLFFKFLPDFKYEGGQGLNAGELRQSLIFPAFQTLQADDCFRGKYSGVNLRVCEELLKNEYHDARGRRHTTTAFRGIAVEMDMNKSFSGHTIVLKDHGLLNAFRCPSGMQNVKLEDPVFEKIFEVYSSDQIEARYLLTTAFMERLLSLRQLYQGKKVQASFFDRKILIAIDTRQDMFEPCSFFKTNLNKSKFDLVFNQIWTILKIIQILKLNKHLGL